jgi:hypothetical protein
MKEPQKKMKYIFCRLALAGILFLGTSSFAQEWPPEGVAWPPDNDKFWNRSTNGWDESFWPASESPPRLGPEIEDGYTNWANQAYNATRDIAFAVAERWEAAYNSDPQPVYSEIMLYGQRRPDLALNKAKEYVLVMYTNFIRASAMETPENINPDELPYYNIGFLLEDAGVTNNFFQTNIVRNLAGHPFAFYESSINLGAEYGWDAMRSVIQQLKYTYQNKGVLIDKMEFQNASGYDVDEQKFKNNCFDETNTEEYELTYESWEESFFIGEGTFGSKQKIYNFDAVIDQQYAREEKFAYPSFLVSNPTYTNSLVTNEFHVAYSWEKITGSFNVNNQFDIRDSEFVTPLEILNSTNAPPDPFSTFGRIYYFFTRVPEYENCKYDRSGEWVYRGTPLKTKRQLEDNSVFFAEGDYINTEINNNGCKIHQWLGGLFSDSIPDDESLICDILPSPTGASVDYGWDISILANRSYAHIIEWDFTYK